MASAIVRGLVEQDSSNRDRINCYSASGKSAQILADSTGIGKADTLSDLLAGSDIVVIAFKPQHLAEADPAFEELTRGKIVLSVLAAKTLDHLREKFPHARNIVRTMPNTPSAIGAGITGWSSQSPLTEPDRAKVVKLLGAIGQEIEVPESKIDALMGISGCGPAFLFEFTGALRDAGVAAGLNPEEAEKLAVETVLGSARLMARSERSPEDLRNEVTSPNGTTFAGLEVLRAAHFRDTMKQVVAAAKSRAAELAES
ncbi:MAG: pyrroline-5-carboxylate reductase [Synoicihabitans sp.]